VTGFDESFLERGVASLVERSAEYDTDEAAFRAVLADDSLIIVDDFFLDGDGSPGGERYGVGEVLTMLDPTSGAAHDVTIAGILNSDFLFAGAYMNADFLEEFLPMDHNAGRWFVTADEGVDGALLASRLDGELLEFGVEAATFDDLVAAEVGETMSILRLFQGFLGIGLVIGIAGLGVVLVRAVHERRREIGVLRALGFQDRVVRRAMLFEAGFLASQGVAIGMGLGLVTAYQGLVNSNTFGAGELTFAWPWAALAVIFAIPTTVALLSAWAPATRAARIAPAVALRAD
jgi:putative ABC transport system permease protein